jgi:hypothetical protein
MPNDARKRGHQAPTRHGETQLFDNITAHIVVPSACDACGSPVWFMALRGEPRGFYHIIDLLGDTHDCPNPGHLDGESAGGKTPAPPCDEREAG